MSKFLPPKLDIESALRASPSYNYKVVQQAFNAWYDREIEPLFENAKEVYSRELDGWRTLDIGNATHSALLINVKPIKEETAVDLLCELLEFCDESPQSLSQVQFGMWQQRKHAIMKRAKDLIEKKK